MAVIDAAKFHHGNGASELEDGAWHIAVFLEWCVENGLAAPEHVAEAVRADPIRYLLNRCGGKLLPSDLSKAGAAFAVRAYGEMMCELADLASAAGVGAFELRTHPEADDFELALFELLDDLWEEENERSA
jgi:hypothetical protein